jgi:hypothetical protein
VGVAIMALEAVYIGITALIIAKEKRAADQREEELR